MADIQPNVMFCSPNILQGTCCYDCGAAAIHAPGTAGWRAAQAWMESHKVICPALKDKKVIMGALAASDRSET